MKAVNELFERRRRALGLSEEAVSKIAELGVEHYSDLESYEDEFWMTLSLRQAMGVCRALGINIAELVTEDAQRSNEAEYQRAFSGADMARLRTQTGLSETELADRIGYDVSTIQSIESDSENLLDCLPLTDVVQYGKMINLDLKTFLSQFSPAE